MTSTFEIDALWWPVGVTGKDHPVSEVPKRAPFYRRIGLGHFFRSALEFVEQVPVKRLTFVPDARVWELIQ
ncbi:MAG: hypothetical protein RL543_1178 [Pseudomonadota bacterium]